LEEARRWYAGEYLADNPYEEWTQRHRAVLQDMYLSVLSQLSTFYSQGSAWERAADCCREILAVDPYHEEAYRQLMRCQAACGRIAEVQRTYWRCKDRLRCDLQLDPAAETVLLYQQLVQPQVAAGV
jgi:DNA-binding SARP family transcriptional activator